MKISDFIFRFAGFGMHDSICRARIYINASERVTVILSDVHGNPGRSVTNAVEYARQSLLERGYVDGDAQIIQHHLDTPCGPDEFSLVRFSAKNAPSWEDLVIEDVLKLTQTDEAELLERANSNDRLASEIARKRALVSPFADFAWPEPPEIVNRRAAIIERMVDRKRIGSLIKGGASERAMQTLLKEDLSLIAEAFANPPEEYICFSEFPIDNGFADFALFSGRSCMDVTLFEIKGADFALVTRGRYKNLSAKVNEGAQQIRTRLGYINRNYEDFRRFAHSVRERVLSGERLYNSLVGPYGLDEVSSDKDIDPRYAVVAGRTVNDLAESKIRRDYETTFNPRIHLETWDSWFKKLHRPQLVDYGSETGTVPE